MLIHGLGGSQMIWAPLLDRLTPSHEVIAVDLPGFGRSPMLADGLPPTPANLGAAVAELCRELGIERPHMGGNSLGGWVALEIAKAGGAASVCAISPAGLWRRPLGPRASNPRSIARRLRPLIGVITSSARARTAVLKTTVARPELLTRREARALIEDWIDSPGYDAANAEMRSRVFEDPELVTVPTTIAWGDADRLLRAPRPERMPPGSRYVVLEGCGHTPTWDDPPRVAELLLSSCAAGQERRRGPVAGAP